MFTDGVTSMSESPTIWDTSEDLTIAEASAYVRVHPPENTTTCTKCGRLWGRLDHHSGYCVACATGFDLDASWDYPNAERDHVALLSLLHDEDFVVEPRA